jgi:hypothetical protein
MSSSVQTIIAPACCRHTGVARALERPGTGCGAILIGQYVGESVRHGDGVVELPLSTMTSSQEPAAGCFAARIDRIVRQGLRPAPRADDHRKVQVGHVEPSGSEWERRGSSTEGLCHGWKCVNRR